MIVSRSTPMPSPGGKGDREAVDEEWRHLTIRNTVHSYGTTFPNIPFSRNAYRFGTDRRSSSAPLRGHLPPGGRYCVAPSLQTPISRAAEESRYAQFLFRKRGNRLLTAFVRHGMLSAAFSRFFQHFPKKIPGPLFPFPTGRGIILCKQ